MNEEYLSRGIDLKRMFLYFQKKIWLIIMLIVLGGTFGGVIYQVSRSMKMPVEYETVSKLYISFALDENGDVYQHYNGYTWNELLDCDPILDLIMLELPGYEKDEVREATTAEILSDIRLLTVTVTGSDEKFVREVRDAVENGLLAFAKESDEISLIKVIRSGMPQRIYWDDRTMAACIMGGVILGVIAVLGFSFAYVFNEAIYVQSDIEKRYPYRALGILTQNQKGLEPYAGELKGNLHYVQGEQKRFAILDLGNHADMRKLEIEGLLNRGEMEVSKGNSEEDYGWKILEDDIIPEKGEWEAVPFNENVFSEEDCARIRELGGVILLLPFGNDVGRKTERILSFLKNQDCPVNGMIIAQADEEFLNRYYA